MKSKEQIYKVFGQACTKTTALQKIQDEVSQLRALEQKAIRGIDLGHTAIVNIKKEIDLKAKAIAKAKSLLGVK